MMQIASRDRVLCRDRGPVAAATPMTYAASGSRTGVQAKGGAGDPACTPRSIGLSVPMAA